MKCSCGNKKFTKEGKDYYCDNCGKKLCDEKVEKYREEKRKEYFNNRYNSKIKKYLPGISLSEIAVIKNCTYYTVWYNRNKFDLIPGIKPERYEFNDKVLDWETKQKERSKNL